jgi:hypothetical protein
MKNNNNEVRIDCEKPGRGGTEGQSRHYTGHRNCLSGWRANSSQGVNQRTDWAKNSHRNEML